MHGQVGSRWAGRHRRSVACAGFWYPQKRISIQSSFVYTVSELREKLDVFTASDDVLVASPLAVPPTLWWLIGVIGLGLLVVSRWLPSTGEAKDQDV